MKCPHCETRTNILKSRQGIFKNLYLCLDCNRQFNRKTFIGSFFSIVIAILSLGQAGKLARKARAR